MNNLFYDNQFGFREGKNTCLAISKLMENLYESFNRSEIKQGVFLDFSKAFDSIDHNILLKKLPYYHFTSSAIKLMSSYLTDRSQYIKLGDHCSTRRKISIGVPQESVLGPLLFLIFINDLINSAPQMEYILFADNTNIFSSEPQVLKEKLFKIEEWCLANRLILNTKKTFQVIFKAPNKVISNPDVFNLSMGNSQLATISSTKFLGIEIDSNITFKTHIGQICRKLNYILLLMRSIRQFLDVPTMTNLYYTFFYPHLAAQCDLNQIVLLQKAALCVILKIHARNHVASNFQRLKIMPVSMLFEYRYVLLFLKQVHEEQITPKINKNEKTRSSAKFLPQRANNCRGERSLLTKGVNLFNSYLMGAEGGRLLGLWIRLTGALWEGGV